MKTNNIATLKACQYYFNFELHVHSIVFTKRTDKLEQNLKTVVIYRPIVNAYTTLINSYFLCACQFFLYLYLSFFNILPLFGE